jgi:hypothetical protein
MTASKRKIGSGSASKYKVGSRSASKRKIDPDPHKNIR